MTRDAYLPFPLDEVEPAPLDIALRFCDDLLDAIDGTALATLEPAGPGVCGQCGDEQRRRWFYGPLRRELCRRCIRSPMRCVR